MKTFDALFKTATNFLFSIGDAWCLIQIVESQIYHRCKMRFFYTQHQHDHDVSVYMYTICIYTCMLSCTCELFQCFVFCCFTTCTSDKKKPLPADPHSSIQPYYPKVFISILGKNSVKVRSLSCIKPTCIPFFNNFSGNTFFTLGLVSL